MANTAEPMSGNLTNNTAIMVAEHQVEVRNKKSILEDVQADDRGIDADIFKNKADTERLASGPGTWRTELFPGIILLSGAFEWAISSLVAQTFFGSSRFSLILLTVVFTAASVGVGWFLGRILREQRSGLRDSATERTIRIAALVIVAGLLIAGYVLRLQAANAVDSFGMLTVLGQALATTMLSAAGIVVAAGFEYYREDSRAVELRRELAKLRQEKAVTVRRLARATADVRHAERAYELMVARAGMAIDTPSPQSQQDTSRVVDLRNDPRSGDGRRS